MIINVYPANIHKKNVFLVHKQQHSLEKNNLITIINAFVYLDIMMMEKINYVKNVNTHAIHVIKLLQIVYNVLKQALDNLIIRNVYVRMVFLIRRIKIYA